MSNAPAGVQAIGAVIPNAVVHQIAAGIPSLIRARAALEHALVGDDQVQRVVAQNRRVAGRGVLTARAGAKPVDVAVSPGRVEVAIRRPSWVPGVGARVFRVTTREGDANQGVGLGERTARRRGGWPGVVRPRLRRINQSFNGAGAGWPHVCRSGSLERENPPAGEDQNGDQRQGGSWFHSPIETNCDSSCFIPS